jgi:hypothetical protein
MTTPAEMVENERFDLRVSYQLCQLGSGQIIKAIKFQKLGPSFYVNFLKFGKKTAERGVSQKCKGMKE